MDRVAVLCDSMAQAENMDELKKYFAEAYKMTAGMKVQKNVQAIYHECKSKLPEAA